MRTKILIIFSFLATVAYSQVAIKGINSNSLPLLPPIDTLDRAILCVHYKLSLINDIRNKNDYQNYNLILQIGKKTSKFCDYKDFINDSIILAEERQKMNKNAIMQGMISRRNKPYTESVFKNMPNGKYTITDKILLNSYSYEEPLPDMQWNITPKDNATIMGYNCTKATCSFRGRNYTAWFANEIAIDNGPWKFHGLPGLILKVEDEEKEYMFECIALYQPRWISPIYRKENSKESNTSREKFQLAKKRAMDNPLLELKNDAKIVSMKTPKGVATKKIAYNPIERNE